jgi:hypothetical protein
MEEYKEKYIKYKCKYLKLRFLDVGKKLIAFVKLHYEEEEYSYNKYIPDPFFDNLQNINLLDWYKKYNPEFKSISEVNPIIEEYNIVIAGIIKDYLILLEKEEFPDNDTINDNDKLKKWGELLINLNYINENLDNLKYIIIFKIINDYLILFNSSISIDNCKNLNIFLNSPYILFPSFTQINYYKINLTIGTPIINFLLSNKQHKSHTMVQEPCWEIHHDIFIHYYNLNIQIFALLYNIDKVRKTREEIIKNILDEIKKDRTIFQNYFENTNYIIENIKNDFIYKQNELYKEDATGKKIRKSFSELLVLPDINKYMHALILFDLFHEKFFFEYLGKNEDYLKYYLRFYNITLKHVFRKDFTSEKDNTIDEEKYNNFNKNSLENVFNGALQLKSDKDKIEFIVLYKRSLKTLHNLLIKIIHLKNNENTITEITQPPGKNVNNIKEFSN